jgi:hypothetical protein
MGLDQSVDLMGKLLLVQGMNQALIRGLVVFLAQG